MGLLDTIENTLKPAPAVEPPKQPQDAPAQAAAQEVSVTPPEAPEKPTEAAAAVPQPPAKLRKTDPGRVAELRAKLDQERRLRETEIAQKERDHLLREAQQLRDLAARDPVRFLEAQGLKPEQIAQVATDPNYRVTREIDAVRAELEQERRSRAQEREQTAVQTAKNLISQYVNSPGMAERYELIRTTGNVDAVVTLIQQHLAETGEALSDEEACDEIEASLELYAEKIVSASKVKSKVSPQSQPAAQPKTLTNNLAAQAPSRVDNTVKPTADFDTRVARMKAQIEAMNRR